MAQSPRLHVFFISLLFFFIISSYLIVFIKYYFFDHKVIKYNPINYNVINTSGDTNIPKTDTNIKKIKSDFINISSEMDEIFKENNFNRQSFLDKSYSNLVIFSSLPDDFSELETIKKKDLFILVLLSVIFIENEKILDERKKILQWWTDTEGELIDRDFWPDWLKEISAKYNFKEKNIGNLLMSVDIVPPSLALAQAAVESGWGSSRYATSGNAVFGQRTFDEESGIIPKKREENEIFLVKKFSSISESASSYIKNLNTHVAYEEFREARKKIRMNGENFEGLFLVNFLKNYSERRQEYIKDIKEIINTNNFQDLDNIYDSKSLINQKLSKPK